MAIWIIIMTMMINLEGASFLGADQQCTKQMSPLRGEQMTCVNATSPFFENFNVTLNRTHWLICKNCSLGSINENTFNFPRNNISFLFLPESKIRTLKKFAFHNLPLLKVLILKENCIENIDQKALNSIKKLFQLDLSKNFLNILTNALFSDLENLDILNLNYNRIFYIQPDAFLGLANLKYLYLSHNCLQKLDDKMFKYLVYLKILYIENNDIVQIHYQTFYNLNNLNYLYLNNNSISFLVQYNFRPLSSLVDLQLRYNNLTEIQTSSFNGLNSIKFLYLGNNQINSVKPYGFIGLESLELLEMNNNDFEVINFNVFSDIKNLKVLLLVNNSITNILIDYKSEVQNSLVLLDISRNNFTFLNYKLLYNKIPNIKEIYVQDNEWKCELIVNMYNYFDSNNVSLCSSNNCDLNVTKTFIDNICRLDVDEFNEEDVSSDFSSDFSVEIHSSSILVFSTFLISFVEII